MIMKFLFTLLRDFDRRKSNLGDGTFETSVKFWEERKGLRYIIDDTEKIVLKTTCIYVLKPSALNAFKQLKW